MIKKILFSVALFIVIVSLASCGGGTGSSSTPQGVNPGVPSVVQLLPVQYVAQTNSSITFKARVLDGNGTPVQNEPVTFTILSSVGTFSSTFADSAVSSFSASPTVVNTDSLGYATINVFGSTAGFATILAQVDTGVGHVRDRKSVYYTTNDVFQATLDLDVNSDPGNETYNETSDITLFEVPFDDTVEVLATSYDIAHLLVVGDTITWSTDQTEATINRQENVTNVNGQANAIVAVDEPLSIRNAVTHVNVMAASGSGAANMVTLFLEGVTIDITTWTTLTAEPSVVNTGGTSTITAVVFLSTGARAPDGITVNFTTTCGTITPFGQTTDGVATATFTAPATPGSCTITASISGTVIGTVTVTVTTPLTVVPSTQSIDSTSASLTATYLIFGGIPSYTVSSNNPAFPPTLTATGFTVTVPASTPATTVTYTIRDSAGSTVTATLTITAGVALTVTPPSATVTGVDNPPAGDDNGGCGADSGTSDDAQFILSGGSGAGTYSLLSSDNTSVINTTGCVTIAGDGTVTVDPDSTAASTTVTLTFRDTSATPQTVQVQVTVDP